LVGWVYDGLKRATPGMPIFHLGGGRIAAYCPVRCGGTLAIQFIETIDGPEAIVQDGDQTGHCSMGCTAEQIMAALAR
jgi:hypothetical protein